MDNNNNNNNDDNNNKNVSKRPQFGNRYLDGQQNNDNVFKHNSWDNVKWDKEQELHAQESVMKNSVVTLTDDQLQNYELEADKYWDSFYDIHENRFFKDRQWLFTEFPELAGPPSSSSNPNVNELNTPERIYPENDPECIILNKEYEKLSISSEIKQRKIFEIGCGVGNTILPILKYSQPDDNLFVYGCDFSPKAIGILKENAEYNSNKCNVFVLDATNENWQQFIPFSADTIDIIILIFVLSAIHPSKMLHVVKQAHRYLKPNGKILFRDYGRYDLAQLRFKPGKCLQDNFYVRGDGTRVYFFTQDEVTELFESAGFKLEQNLIDRRLQVNRGKMLKMYRVWIQAKFRKPGIQSAE